MPVMSSRDTVTDTTNIESQLLQVLARQGRMAVIPVLSAMSIIAVFAINWFPYLFFVWGWLLCVALLLIVRWIVLGRLPGLDNIPENTKLRIAVFLSAINGVTHGLSLCFFPYLPVFERTVHSLFLVGISAIAVVTTAGYRPISLAYILPTLVPMSILWAYLGYVEGNWIHYTIALMGGLFTPILIRVAADTFSIFRDSIETRKKLSELNIQLESALNEARIASSAKTRFLASATHDLRQPIHTLSLFSAALAMRPLDDQSREIAEHMDKALQVLASQLDALLDISKLDAGVVHANNEIINLSTLVTRISKENLPLALEKNLKLELNCPEDVIIETDEQLLERIIRNLLSNAIKYTDKGNINIKISPELDNYVLSIEDSGYGIPEEEHSHIFEEFYQINNPERDRSKGLGLGLAITKRISELLKLPIEMKSSLGKGTVFQLTFLKAKGMEKNKLFTSTIAKSWDTLQVLVVDDETEVGLAMKTLLESLGCQVMLSDSTTQAVTEVNNIKPHIILVDFRLRGDDNGITAIQEIRKIYPDMPAILISGDTAPHRLLEANETNIELLHKPVLVDVLKQAISKACNI
jgi:signal transduction histidine kinase